MEKRTSFWGIKLVIGEVVRKAGRVACCRLVFVGLGPNVRVFRERPGFSRTPGLSPGARVVSPDAQRNGTSLTRVAGSGSFATFFNALWTQRNAACFADRSRADLIVPDEKPAIEVSIRMARSRTILFVPNVKLAIVQAKAHALNPARQSLELLVGKLDALGLQESSKLLCGFSRLDLFLQLRRQFIEIHGVLLICCCPVNSRLSRIIRPARARSFRGSIC